MISALPIVPEDDVDPNLIGFRYLLDFKTIDKSLAQIMSPDIGFYNSLAKLKGNFKTITLTLILAFISTLTPTLIPTLTLTH